MKPRQARTLRLLLAGEADPKRTSRRNNPEQQIQRAVCQHLQARGVSGLVWFHVPNGGWRSRTEAAIMKGCGVKAGVSDLILLHEGRFYALELKVLKGKETEAQCQFSVDVIMSGGIAWCARGLDEALSVLEQWGLLRTQRQAA